MTIGSIATRLVNNLSAVLTMLLVGTVQRFAGYMRCANRVHGRQRHAAVEETGNESDYWQSQNHLFTRFVCQQLLPNPQSAYGHVPFY